ncbi:MAG: hypothetical protein EGMGGAKC_00970 [Dehalococcoides mccartyi]|nr:hypothetical protein [Dehalococcoides mccartyi]
MVCQRVFGNNHPGSMGGSMAGKPLYLSGGIHQITDHRILIVHIFQFGAFFHSLVQGHVKGEGYDLGYPVHISIGHTKRPPHIPHRRFCPQRTKGNNLGNMVTPVLAHHIFNDLLTAVILKVHVYIRHFLAFNIQKTLKNQLIFNRVKGGNTQTVQHYRRSGAAADAVIQTLFFYKTDNIPGNQKVIGKLGGFNNIQLIFQAVKYFLAGIRIKLGQPLITQICQILIRGFTGRDIYLRQVQTPEIQAYVAHFGYLGGVFNGIRYILIGFRHFFR